MIRKRLKMLSIFFCLLTLHCQAIAKSSRTINLSEGEMTPIFVEPGYSTLLKFSSHPEPGLVGDQDGFKIEYMKNIVAIKPLVPKGKTNLFVFTKDGQFGFQLVASRGHHDNIVYVEPQKGTGTRGPTSAKTVIAIDDLLTKRMNRSAKISNLTFTLDSIATPMSRSTLVLRFHVQQVLGEKIKPVAIDSKFFQVLQGNAAIKIENIFLELKNKTAREAKAEGLILIRAEDLKKKEPVKIILSLPNKIQDQKPTVFSILFDADIHQ